MRTVALADGERTRVVRCPPPPGVADPPVVVCVHGWGCSIYSWNRVLRRIADAGCDVWAPDVRGHGWSDKPLRQALYTPDALGAWLVALLDRLGIARAVLVGHSMGGSIVVRAALQAGERVAGLVLLAPVGFCEIPRVRLLRLVTPGWLAPVLPWLARRSLIGLGLRTGYGRIGRPTARDVDEYWAPTADPDFVQAARLAAHGFEWDRCDEGALARLAAPVHVVLGTRDNLIPASATRAYVERLARVRVDAVPDAGHVLPEEVPDLVATAVAEDARRWWGAD